MGLFVWLAHQEEKKIHTLGTQKLEEVYSSFH
jgi:hypothetical protein